MMLRKKSKAVSEGNAPTPQDAYKIITCEKLRRVLSESMSKAFGEFKGDMRSIDQRLASLEQLGSHVLPWRQTCQQTRRHASARMAPLLQFKQSMEIAVLQTGSIPT